MSTHPLVQQLRFARSEFRRALAGVSDADAQKRFLPMNCISWNVGHLAWQEQRYWLVYAQKQQPLHPDIDELFAYGAPASTPALTETLAAWEAITRATDPWLDTVTTETLQQKITRPDRPGEYGLGSMLLRMIYHYWYHAGENMAIRQMLGQTNLPQFVGNIDGEAPYRPE